MGIHSARKLKDNNKEKNTFTCKKNHKPSHVSGIVKEKIAFSIVTPNYGRKYCVLVELKTSGKEIMALVPYDGGLNFIEIGDKVLLERKKINDIPNCNYRCIKSNGISIKYHFENPDFRFRHSDIG